MLPRLAAYNKLAIIRRATHAKILVAGLPFLMPPASSLAGRT
jgi:hypothetical protein